MEGNFKFDCVNDVTRPWICCLIHFLLTYLVPVVSSCTCLGYNLLLTGLPTRSHLSCPSLSATLYSSFTVIANSPLLECSLKHNPSLIYILQSFYLYSLYFFLRALQSPVVISITILCNSPYKVQWRINKKFTWPHKTLMIP